MKTMIKYICCSFALSCVITHSNKPSGALEYGRRLAEVRRQEAKRQQEAAKRAAAEAQKRQEQASKKSEK